VRSRGGGTIGSTGETDMVFFTARERTEARSQETQLRVQSRMQPKARTSVPDDFYQPRRPADNDLAGRFGSLLEQAGSTSLREIDNLIDELRSRRENLLSESTRLQSAIVEYAKSTQLTLESTRSVTESLAFLHKVPDVPKKRARETESTSNAQDRESSCEESTEYGSGPEATFTQAEDKVVPGTPTSDPT
jgi:hypothetical protein